MSARSLMHTVGLLDLARRFVNRTRPKFKRRRRFFKDAYGLEIGGPSHVFSEGGPLPVYTIARRIDNLDFSDTTFWISGCRAEEYRPSRNLEAGKNFYIDTEYVADMPIGQYDFLIASHVIEHLANPIKSILAWKRLLKSEGVMILIAPCKYFSYDCDRTTTTISHLVEDFQRDVGEDDLTHMDEVVAKHNLRKDKTVSSRAQHIERTMKNYDNRIMHHHVFDLKLLRGLGEECGLTILESEYIWPRHVACIFMSK